MLELGVDVSRHNGKIDWKETYKAGVRIAAIRFTVGNYYVDPRAVENYNNARDAGMKTTLYNVIAPAMTGDPSTRITGAEHIKWFETAMLGEFGTMQPELDSPLIWDCELHRGQDPRYCTTVTQECFELTQCFAGFDHPMCYTSAGYWNANIFPMPSWQLYPLFVANWYALDPLLPRDWNTWKAWQFTNLGNGTTYGQERGTIDLARWKETDTPEPTEKFLLKSVLEFDHQIYQGSVELEPIPV